MVDAKTRYSKIEQTFLALKNAHQVTVLTNQPLRVTLHKLNLSGRMLKWAIELSEYEIMYQPRLSLKRQVMADFIVELPKKPAHPVNPPRWQWWTFHVDRASRVSESGIGLILQSPAENC
ncbi:hypothetical protein AAG906_038574 [Vitis piasezkii]